MEERTDGKRCTLTCGKVVIAVAVTANQREETTMEIKIATISDKGTVYAKPETEVKDASSPALKKANEKASEAVAEYWKKVGFKP